jgi:hypothetical protein
MIGLLDHGRPEAACAAAIVLGELSPGDPKVRRALARRLPVVSACVRPYVRDALARSGSDAALARLAVELRHTGVGREQAARLLRAHGERALPHLDRLLRDHPLDGGRHIFELGASVVSDEVARWLAAHLRDAPAHRARALGRVLRPQVLSAWRRSLRSAFRARVVDLVRDGTFGSAEGVRVAFRVLTTV